MVYAFEPNWELARQIMGKAANFVVFPMAVSEKNGLADFFVRSDNESTGSSLFSFDKDSVAKHWPDIEVSFGKTLQVPTIRLDTFMDMVRIDSVDYLKVDAQGAEFAAIQSAGNRLADIKKITAEIYLTTELPFKEAACLEAFTAFLSVQGFTLTGKEIEPKGRHGDFTFEKSRHAL
jgi:FkbM family methyltransferase